MGWIIVGGMLLIAAFVYVSLQLIALVARGILFVGASALRAIASLLK